MNKVLTILILCLYNLALMAGTAWLVVEHEWSPWWFALSVCILGSYGKDDEDKNNGRGSE